MNQSCMHRNDKIFLPSKLRINTCIVIIFLFSILKMLSKEISLKTNVVVSPEKQLFSAWPCKPGFILPSTFEIKYANTCTGFFGAKVLANERKIF